MVGFTEADASDLSPNHDECKTLREHTHNVLLEGPVGVTDRALRLIVGSGEQIEWAGVETLSRISAADQTLILRNVDSLGGDAQRRLLEWLDPIPSRARIISTSERALFAHVTAGSFDTALYYRLNIVLLRFRSKAAAHSPSRDAQHQEDSAAVAG